MKIFLDDERQPPPGWTLVRSPQEVIEILQNNPVEMISLDHDLGDDSRGTGYDVILWIEEQVAFGKMIPPVLLVHSANASARLKMLAGIQSIYRLANALTSKNADRNQ